MANKEPYKAIYELNSNEKYIKMTIPLADPSGKTRVKSRSGIRENGMTVATRTEQMTPECYIEWQISYDVKVNDEKKITTLKDGIFIGSNKAKKNLFELSECIKYFYDWGLILKEELTSIKDYLSAIPEENLIDVNSNLLIKRTDPVERKINDMKFLFARVEYPLLIYRFREYKIITEIQTKEKQYAVGTQPMLYFCFDLSELDNGRELYNRTAKSKEIATFTFNENNKDVLLEMLKIFGTLSMSHKKDVISIINLILEWGEM